MGSQRARAGAQLVGPVIAGQRRTFPLLPRRPLVGNPFGTARSKRRGPGADVIGSRPYVPGDRLAAVDWHASARLSAVTGRDEFVVRETLSDDAPRVVIVCDRRPAMALYPPALPFVSKHDAVFECVAAITASARAARAAIGWCDVTAGGQTWLPPRNVLATAVVERRLAAPWDGPTDGLAERDRRRRPARGPKRRPGPSCSSCPTSSHRRRGSSGTSRSDAGSTSFPS